jgi:hypothetical protein
VHPDIEPRFRYRREREMLEYQLTAADIVMRTADGKTGYMLLDERYSRDVALVESRERKEGHFVTRFNSNESACKALINQYIDNLLDRKIALPKIRSRRERKLISRQVELLHSHPSKVIARFPEYKEFMDACARYTETTLVRQMDGKYNLHTPIPTERQQKPREDNLVKLF